MRNRFIRGLIGLVFSAALVVQAAPAAHADVTGVDPETQFLNRLNEFRAGRGLGPLTIDGELTEVARHWSVNMAGQHAIFHNQALPKQVHANWRKLGENVGLGPQVDDIFDAFIASPTHLANVVNPAYTKVGIGVVSDEYGTLYTAQEFMSLRSAKGKKVSRHSVRRR